MREDINKLRQFIIKYYQKGKKSVALTDDTSLFGEGIIDSLGALKLVAYIEETYGFKVKDEELIPDNLDSINKLDAYINSKLETIAAAT